MCWREDTVVIGLLYVLCYIVMSLMYTADIHMGRVIYSVFAPTINSAPVQFTPTIAR